MIPRRLAAAQFLVRLGRAGVELRWASPGTLQVRDEPGALTDALRAEIDALRPELAALLEPWNLPIGERRFALLAAAEDPGWRQTGYGICAVCDRGTVWTSPDGVPMHPWCDPLLGIL